MRRVILGMAMVTLIAAACAVLATVLGTVVGVFAGVWGGWVDRVVMRATDAVNALPHLLLGIVIVAMFRGSITAIVLSIALTHWTQVARSLRVRVARTSSEGTCSRP